MPPKFALQTVLDVRHSRVESLEIQLGQLLQAQREGMDTLALLETNMQKLFDQLHEKASGDIDLFAVRQLQENVHVTQEQIKRVQEALDLLAQKIDAKRQELVIARQEEEVIKSLKEKELERYLIELAQRENREQDDIYIARAFRQTKE